MFIDYAKLVQGENEIKLDWDNNADCAKFYVPFYSPCSVHQGGYSRILASSEESTSEALEVICHMNNNRPYLDPDLKLYPLAAQLRMSAHSLSHLLNQSLAMNFQSFVNRFRVNDAILKLCEPDYQRQSITRIMVDSGFNSKSVFYSYFKKFVGQTPRELLIQARSFR